LAWLQDFPNEFYVSRSRRSKGIQDLKEQKYPFVSGGKDSRAVAVAHLSSMDSRPLVAVGNYNAKNQLFISSDKLGGFKEITTGPFVSARKQRTSAVVTVDVNNDNFVDILVGNVGIFEPNEIYAGNGKGDFSQHTAGSFVTTSKSTSALAVADLDNDGWLVSNFCPYSSPSALR
jgi:hypothetical protein